jgi:L-alanine-DL-glutamate epimerase-like enolase superfamily enzyme
MQIAHIETYLVRLPFKTGAPARPLGGRSWATLDHVFVKIETADGLVGWGDAFGYGAAVATKAALDHMIAPALIGRDARQIASLSRELQRHNHLWGRYGVTMFAISGIDIALWDLAAKAANVPLVRLLGGAVRTEIPAYASLFKYEDPDIVAERVQAALQEGYGAVKLHETGVDEVAAARQAAGDEVPLMIDTNCPWTPREAREAALAFLQFDPYWLEEPIFPPEDYDSLARLQQEVGIAIATGENACTAFEFQKMFSAGAVSFAQPSVTKVGGITEMLKIQALAETHGVALMPHSPYFGAGFLATLHVAAAMPDAPLIERFYMEVDASPYGDIINVQDGVLRLPDGPGLGREPDLEVIREFSATP